MKEIKNILICGIGAIGAIYANKINQDENSNLKILIDKTRLEKYKKNAKIFNGKKLELDYVLPENTDYKADLIIIATKFDAIYDVKENIKNFVKDNTIIISLLNGVTSEEILASKYGWNNIPLAYFIGHSAMRSGNLITHDGLGEIVFGLKDDINTSKEIIDRLKNYFDRVGISYRVPEDMYRAYWLKFMLNVSSNQPSSILRLTFGQMQENKSCINFIKNIMKEVQKIAKAQGVKNTDTMIEEAFISFNKMIKEGKTSMLQDVEAKRKTEVDMFAGTIIEFGKKHNIPTPYNMVLKEMIEVIHETF